MAHGLVELVEQPHPVLRASGEARERPAGDGVTGVDLHATGLEQPRAGVHQVVAFDLLGVTAGGREHQHRYAEVTPSCHRELLLHPV